MKQLTKVVFFLLLIILFSIIIRMFIGEPSKVSSSSMEPTIKSGDWLWINKVDYGAILPRRWADIPLLNIITWSSKLRKRDKINDWGYYRIKGLIEPKIGDIVVFNSPENIDLLLVKRVSQILYAGTRIYLDSTNYVTYNNIIEQEKGVKTKNTINVKDTLNNRYNLKNKYYYLLGDNDSISRDSRFFGYVSEKNIVGKVNRVIFSTQKGENRFLKKLD